MEYQGVVYPIDPLKERNAIVGFLKKNWEVKIGKNLSLDKLVDEILEIGIEEGIGLGEKQAKECWNGEPGEGIYGEAVILNRKTKSDYTFVRTKFPVTKKNWRGKDLQRLAKKISRTLVSEERLFFAEPKGYEKYFEKNKDNSPEILKVPNYGVSNPHHWLFGRIPFTENLSCPGVLYNYNQNSIKPRELLVESIIFQGMNVGFGAVWKFYQEWTEDHRAILCKLREKGRKMGVYP